MKNRKKCFVVMAIGNQSHNGTEISATELKEKYNDLIKEAIQSIDSTMEVTRGDEVAEGGSISTDIFKRLILSDYVVVDITYPNPNVFYELGIRHAVRNKTILIKEKGSDNNPFDISNLRYITYENTPSGLKNLKAQLSETFKNYENTPNLIDNDFLTIALSMGLFFQKLKQDPKKEGQKKALRAIMQSPEIRKEFAGDDHTLFELFSNMENIDEVIDGIVDGGFLDEEN